MCVMKCYQLFTGSFLSLERKQNFIFCFFYSIIRNLMYFETSPVFSAGGGGLLRSNLLLALLFHCHFLHNNISQ